LNLQKTIESAAAVEGRGLFGGQACRLRFVPAAADSGIVFVRTDIDGAEPIPCEPASLAGGEKRRTVLRNQSASVATVEHVLSAVVGMGIDNAAIEMDAEEVPSTDGSPLPFAEALRKAGIVEQDAEQEPFVITEPVAVSEGEATLAALPGPADRLDIVYHLEYSTPPSIGRQVCAFRLGADDYARELAPARTFLVEEEARVFQAQGIGRHLRAGDILVMGEKGAVGSELRFPDEPARHKVCDLLGDLALLGRPLRGRIVASRSGHELNHALARRLLEAAEGRGKGAAGGHEPLLDIRAIMRLLPHRYPFLMVDRIVRVEGDERAVGIKNVTINEPYFQGHYPAQPIMPGVMILEALAQMSGILLSRRLEHAGKVAVLLSMDRVKMRRPVRPGDQLVLEATALRVRPRTGHCQCRAMVDGDLAAEAEIKFMLVDAEPA
jgi:UDP-3-O-[3-hydroxymyristoyl] N-acetylglucosamine deacetylase/3-hydroxyacyl-[acyl-carrier-protein] dehydratase